LSAINWQTAAIVMTGIVALAISYAFSAGEERAQILTFVGGFFTIASSVAQALITKRPRASKRANTLPDGEHLGPPDLSGER
jgi:nicotinamide riboside transporter PnuC